MIKIYKSNIKFMKTCPRCKRVFNPKIQLREYNSDKKCYECPECGLGVK